MSALFIDSSGWLAALSPKELTHARARMAYRDALTGRSGVLTTNLVVAEMHALLLRRRGAEDATRFLQNLHLDPSHEVVYVDRDLERAAVDHWVIRYRDAAFSLADATSFEVMHRRGVRAALTLDRHFAIAGFEMRPSGS